MKKISRRRNDSKDKDKHADVGADAGADAGADDNEPYGDSKFLAMRDSTIKNLRSSEKDTKHKIIEKMLTLQHNMKYNRHLLSVYMKAKELFDKMVEEHRMQIHSLEEIHHHLNHLIRENLSAKRIKSKKDAAGVTSSTMTELMKDKKRIGALLKKMRDSYEKLMNIDTVIGVTIQQINEITFMDDEKNNGDDTEGDDGQEEETEGDDTDGDYGDYGDEGDEGDEGDDTEGDDTEGDDTEDDDTEDDADTEGEDDGDEDVEDGEDVEDVEDGEDEGTEDEADAEGELEEEDDEREADEDDEVDDTDVEEDDHQQDNNMFIGVF